jgi:ribosomal protein S4
MVTVSKNMITVSKNKKWFKNKLYRRFGDMFCRLALKRRYNHITQLVHAKNKIELMRILRKQPKNLKRGLYKKIFSKKRIKGKQKPRKRFAFNINTQNHFIKRRKYTRHGNLLSLRKSVSLYYGGGKIRRNSFIRYNKMRKTLMQPENVNCLSSGNNSQLFKRFSSIIENRLDVALLRSQFLTSIRAIRGAILKNKIMIKGRSKINHPAYILRNWEFFSLKNKKQLKYNLKVRLKHKAIVGFSRTFYFNFIELIACKTEELSGGFGLQYSFIGNKMNYNTFSNAAKFLFFCLLIFTFLDVLTQVSRGKRFYTTTTPITQFHHIKNNAQSSPTLLNLEKNIEKKEEYSSSSSSFLKEKECTVEWGYLKGFSKNFLKTYEIKNVEQNAVGHPLMFLNFQSWHVVFGNKSSGPYESDNKWSYILNKKVFVFWQTPIVIKRSYCISYYPKMPSDLQEQIIQHYLKNYDNY